MNINRSRGRSPAFPPTAGPSKPPSPPSSSAPATFGRGYVSPRSIGPHAGAAASAIGPTSPPSSLDAQAIVFAVGTSFHRAKARRPSLPSRVEVVPPAPALPDRERPPRPAFTKAALHQRSRHVLRGREAIMPRNTPGLITPIVLGGPDSDHHPRSTRRPRIQCLPAPNRKSPPLRVRGEVLPLCKTRANRGF